MAFSACNPGGIEDFIATSFSNGSDGKATAIKTARQHSLRVCLVPSITLRIRHTDGAVLASANGYSWSIFGHISLPPRKVKETYGRRIGPEIYVSHRR